MAGFVTSKRNKRSAATASLDELEARVAQLRKVTGSEQQQSHEMEDGNDGKAQETENGNDEDIIIDDIDAEIEEAAASGCSPTEDAFESLQPQDRNLEDRQRKGTTKQDKTVHDVTTKAIPDAVFGGLQ